MYTPEDADQERARCLQQAEWPEEPPPSEEVAPVDTSKDEEAPPNFCRTCRYFESANILSSASYCRSDDAVSTLLQHINTSELGPSAKSVVAQLAVQGYAEAVRVRSVLGIHCSFWEARPITATAQVSATAEPREPVWRYVWRKYVWPKDDC